jgi:ribose 5-phosphate isomerase B
MTLFLASDHAGFHLKEALKRHLSGAGHELHDFGAVVEDVQDDYPDMVIPCAKKVAETPGSFGIILGASGQGEAMAANRVSGIRAAVYYGPTTNAQKDINGTTLGMIESVRMHNDANILSIGARFVTEREASEAVDLFLGTAFSGDERHVRRLGKF